LHSVSYFTNLDPAPEQTKAAEDSHDQAGDTAIEPNSEGTTTSGKHNESYNIRATGANILDPTHGYGIELAEDQQDAPDNVVSGQALNMGATLMYRRYITGKIQMQLRYHTHISKSSPSDLRLHCTTEGVDFPPLNTVRLVVFGLTNEEGALGLEKESRYTWKQTSVAEM